jgi:hypothetical protein
MEKKPEDWEKLAEMYDRARFKAFCNATIMEKLKFEDPELLFYLQEKKLKLVQQTPYIVSLLVFSFLGHAKGLNRFLGKGFHLGKAFYYSLVFISCNSLIGYLLYDASKTRHLSIKYESVLLEVDPSLRQLRENYRLPKGN